MRGGDPHTKFLAPNPNLQLASFYHLDFSKKSFLPFGASSSIQIVGGTAQYFPDAWTRQTGHDTL